MLTLQQLISQHPPITCKIRFVGMGNWPDGGDSARKFSVMLYVGGTDTPFKKMRVPFYQGTGHTADPTIFDVLDCLASDASGVENARNFEEWCGEYGYDIDSRKAERVYKKCQKSARQLKDFLGTARYETLLWETERD